jgi:hypothetical protein
MSIYQTTATAFLVIFVIGELLRRRARASNPPGPLGYPIIGNLFDAPRSMAWLAYERLSKDYGKF